MVNKFYKCLVVIACLLMTQGCVYCIGVNFTNRTRASVKVLSVKTNSSGTEYVDELGTVRSGQTVHFDCVFPEAFPEFHLRIKDAAGKTIREIRANGDTVRHHLVQNSWVVSL